MRIQRDSNPVLSALVKKHDLKPGDQMVNVKNEAIPDSVVIDNYTVLMREDNGGYRLIAESAIGHEETHIFMNADALAVIRNSTF